MENILLNPKPMMKPEMIADRKIPVPVALSQFSPKTAGSLTGLGKTTGGTRSTILFSGVIGNCGLVILLGGVLQLAIEVNVFSGAFMKVLPVFVPQVKTITLRMSHGSQARTTSPRL